MATTNLLLVVLGGVRADHTSCYGYSKPTTPFLDEVAQQGVRFPNMISTAPWALPAHASLLTGQFPATHGATHEHHFLTAEHAVLPEYLQARGYRTAAFSANEWVSPETGFGRGFDAFFTQRYNSRLASRAVTYGRRAGDRLLRRKDSGARRTNQALLEWLAADERPFFAFVHYQETRLPVDPPSPFDEMFVTKDSAASSIASLNQDCDRYFAGEIEFDGATNDRLRALYDGAVRYIDSRLHEVAMFLQQRGVWDDTLVVITGDHGESLGERGLLGHRFTLADSLLRVPLVLRCPRNVPQGFALEEVAQTSDILPTVLELLEIPQEPAAVQGRVLLREGRATPSPRYAFAERFRPNLDGLRKRFPRVDARALDVRMKAIRSNREKFVWHSDEANEFYDLAVDPGETRNLIGSEPARAEALRRKLFDWFAGIPHREPTELRGASGSQGQLSYSD
jgi:arylsulfatase A-like enzyme